MSAESDFKQLPTLSQIEKRVRELHQMFAQLAQGVGGDLADLQKTIQDSTAITDQVLEEMSLQIAFIMQQIALSKPLHGGIADLNGKVPMEKETLAQIYVETGRAKMLQQRAEMMRAQGLPPAESAPDASGEAAAPTPADDGAAQANAEAGFPKLITH